MGILALQMLGCSPSDNILVNERQNPHLKEGLARVSALDYNGAIRQFEKALEANPNSVRAHFELGIAYQDHKQDYVSALYHFKKVLELKDTGWPAENVRELMARCRYELVRSEALNPMLQALRKDLDDLRQENARLREQLAAAKTGSPPSRRSPVNDPRESDSQRAIISRPPSPPLPTETAPAPSPSPTPKPYQPSPRVLAMQSSYVQHVIRSGETLMALQRRYGVSVEAIMQANPGLNPRSIPVGESIRIPVRR